MKSEKTKSFRSDKYVVSYPVEPQHEGLRLDAFAHLFMPTLSREFIKKKIEKGEITISSRAKILLDPALRQRLSELSVPAALPAAESRVAPLFNQVFKRYS